MTTPGVDQRGGIDHEVKWKSHPQMRQAQEHPNALAERECRTPPLSRPQLCQFVIAANPACTYLNQIGQPVGKRDLKIFFLDHPPFVLAELRLDEDVFGND